MATLTTDEKGLGPFLLDDDPRIRWKAWGYVVDGQFWPYRVEVRLKTRPCHHDSGLDIDALIDEGESDSGALVGSSSPCDCWDNLDRPTVSELSDMNPGRGISARTLRSIRLGDAERRWREMLRNAQTHGLGLGRTGEPNGPGREVLQVLSDEAETHEGSRRIKPGPGRKPTPRTEHRKRMSALVKGYDDERTLAATARRSRISLPRLRATLEWARDHEPPLWERGKQGMSSAPTEAGRAFAEGTLK